MINMKKQAVASNGKAAVLIGESELMGLVPIRHAPSGVGAWDRREEYNALCDRAAAKLGYKRDKRCRNGWRKQPEAAR
jgi:hypothetical protein